MNCQEIIEELHILAEGRRTDSTNEAITEAVEIIEDWAFVYGQRKDRKKEE